MKRKINIIFFGTPKYALPVLSMLNSRFHLLAAVTQPDKKIGRKKIAYPPPVKTFCEENSIPVFQPNDVSDIAGQLAALKADIGIIFAYRKRIPQNIISIFPNGIINIHPSLLPKYRGSSPIQAAIRNRDAKTGVTIIRLDEKLDHGPILFQKEVSLHENETTPLLTERLIAIGTRALEELLPKFCAGEIHPKEQDHSQATFTRELTSEDGKIDWNQKADEVFAQYRAHIPWPGTHTLWKNKRLLLLGVSPSGVTGRTPGLVFVSPSGALHISCGVGSVTVGSLQLEGKKELSFREFLNGYPQIIGETLPS